MVCDTSLMQNTLFCFMTFTQSQRGSMWAESGLWEDQPLQT